MLLQLVMEKFLPWINEAVNLMTAPHSLATVAEMYRALGLMYYSHTSGCSLRKGIDTLQRLGCDIPQIGKCRYILRHIFAFPATVQREYSEEKTTCISQRDMTVQLNEIERFVFGP